MMENLQAHICLCDMIRAVNGALGDLDHYIESRSFVQLRRFL